MKKKKTLIAILTAGAFLFAGCKGNNSNGNNSSNSNTETTSNSDSKSAVNTSFSATIDGVSISGNQTGELQLQNTVFLYPKKDESPEHLLFFLTSNKQGEDFYSLRFSFPDKEGQYKYTPEIKKTCYCNLKLDFYLKSKDYYPTYNEDSVTVSIDKITSSRITGTFSSQLTNLQTSRYPNHVMITDGKFDLPFSTGNMRPE